jgi:hypothetical protein
LQWIICSAGSGDLARARLAHMYSTTELKAFFSFGMDAGLVFIHSGCFFSLSEDAFRDDDSRFEAIESL